VITVSGLTLGYDERVVMTINSGYITSSDMSVAIEKRGSPFLFMGSDTEYYIGLWIDSINNGYAEYTEFKAEIMSFTLNGDKIIPVTYPGDFTQINNDLLTFDIVLNGVLPDFSGTSSFIEAYGVALGSYGIHFNTLGTIGADPYTHSILGFPFIAGSDIKSIIISIDSVPFISEINDGDFITVLRDYKVNTNNTISVDYPSDFTQVTGSGYAAINLKNAYDEYAGKTVIYGCSGIPYNNVERIWESTIIDSNNMMLPVKRSGMDFLFAGGIEIGEFGVFIDLNDDSIPDNGDWYASEENVTINGDTVITFSY
jgi:hypothetical protein